MKPIFNTLLIVLLGGLLAFAGTGCSAGAKKAYHARRAENFFAADQLDRAEIEYIGVLRNDPANANAMGKLGIIYYEEGRFQRALPLLMRGIQLATNNVELHLRLGFIESAAGNTKAARTEADFILAQNPRNNAAPILYAETASSPQEITTARQRLQKLSAQGDSAALETALGILALREQDYPAAEHNLKQAQSLDPKFAAAYAASGTLEQERNNLKAAAADFEAAAKLSSSRSPEKLECVQFEIQTGNLPAAKALLARMAQVTPDYLPVRIGQAEIALAETNLDECATALNEVLSREPENCDALLLNGRLALARGDAAKAVSGLERLGQLYPQLARANYELAQAYLANRDPQKGIGSLQRAVQLNSSYTEAILLLANLKINTGNAAGAVTVLEPLVRQKSAPVQASWLLAEAYRNEGHLDAALTIYRQLEQSFPQNSQIALLTGTAFIQKKDPVSARQEFSRVLALSPGNFAALEQLAGMDLTENRFTDAIELVKTAVENHPDQAELRLLQAKVFLAMGNTNQAEATLNSAIELQPELQSAYLLLAQLYLDSHQNQKALAIVETALKKNPDNAAALMFKGILLTGDGEFAAAADAYEKVLAKNPDFGPALNNLACLYSEQLNQPDRARDLAQHARQLFPSDPSIADTLGWVFFRKGDYASAIALLQKSAPELAREPEAQFHLGMASYLAGNENTARASFQRALQIGVAFSGEDECTNCLAVLRINPQAAGADARLFLEKRTAANPGDVTALRRLAAIYQNANEPEKAITLNEAILKISPQNIASLTALAQLYSVKDPTKALATAKTAYQLAPNDPVVAGIFGRLAAQNGNYKLAFSILEPEVNTVPADPQRLFYFAEAAYAIGKSDAAQAAMQNSLAAGLSAAQANEARDFLTFTSEAAKSAPSTAGQSRAREVLKSDAENVPALMVMGTAASSKKNISEAEHIYEAVLKRFPEFVPAQRNLALLYVRDGSHPEDAYALVVKASQAFPNDVELTKALAVAVFRQANYQHAATLLKTIADETNPDPELLYYLGISEYHLKHFSESKTSLQRALDLNLPVDQATNAKSLLARLK